MQVLQKKTQNIMDREKNKHLYFAALYFFFNLITKEANNEKS